MCMFTSQHFVRKHHDVCRSLHSEREKLAAAAKAAVWREAKIAGLEESLQEDLTAALPAVAEAQHHTGAAMAAIQAVRELVAMLFVGRNPFVENDCKAAYLDDK